MVQVYRPGKSSGRKGARKKSGLGKPKQQGRLAELKIDSIDHEAKGVARGKPTTFVPGALPGERCKVRLISQQRGVQQAELVEVLEASEHRQTPFCPHYSHCGGCHTQHIQHDWFLSEKQQALTFLLNKLTGSKGQTLPWQPPVVGAQTGYRRKARLALDARDKTSLKLGFRDRQNEVFFLTECQVLTPELQQILSPLQSLIAKLSCLKKLGHISLFDGQRSGTSDRQVYVFLRLPAVPDVADKSLLQEFEIAAGCSVVLHLDNEQFVDLNGNLAQPEYQLSLQNDAINISLNGNDFVQVNGDVNNKMVQRALDWLALSSDDRVLDLFCGVGNFSLPIARQCQWVTGFEGVPEMVQMAQNNAQRNHISNTRFVSGDLTREDTLTKLAADNCNKVLLDPARAGAFEAVKMLLKLQPEVIVYVSCNPATFGRDIACLLHENYQLKKLSLIDMFPATAHSELMGVFSRV